VNGLGTSASNKIDGRKVPAMWHAINKENYV